MRWFLCVALPTLAICLAAIAVVVVLAHIANPNPGCLSVSHDHVDIIDPKTGKEIIITGPQDDAAGRVTPPPITDVPVAYSSDGKRMAYLTDFSADGLHTAQWAISFYSFYTYTFRNDDPFSGNILWSPNNHWIAYRWYDGHDHLAIADSHGNQQNITTIDDTSDERAAFMNWSADSKYIAVINQGALGAAGRIRFFSVPDLKLLNSAETLSGGCVSPLTNDSSLRCYPWAAKGHYTAYVTDKENTANSLVISSMSDQADRIIPVPPATLRTVRVSPDGRHTAIASFTLGDFINSSTDGTLALYNADGTVLQKLSDIAIVNFGDSARISHAEIDWSPDSRYMVYLRHDPDAQAQMQMMLYDPRTTEHRSLLKGLEDSVYDIAISADSQYIAVSTAHETNPNKLYLVSVYGGQSNLISNQSSNSSFVEWSPDGKMLTFIESAQSGTKAKVIAPDGTELVQIDIQYIDSLYWTGCR